MGGWAEARKGRILLKGTILLTLQILFIAQVNEGSVQATGAKYEGEYQNDLKHGRGKYTYPNGDIYDGEWSEGKRHGKGLYRNKETGGV